MRKGGRGFSHCRTAPGSKDRYEIGQTGGEGLEIGRPLRGGEGQSGHKPGYLLPPAGTEILVELKPDKWSDNLG